MENCTVRILKKLGATYLFKQTFKINWTKFKNWRASDLNWYLCKKTYHVWVDYNRMCFLFILKLFPEKAEKAPNFQIHLPKPWFMVKHRQQLGNEIFNRTLLLLHNTQNIKFISFYTFPRNNTTMSRIGDPF